jgi:Protein of unknown function (DUF1579)
MARSFAFIACAMVLTSVLPIVSLGQEKKVAPKSADAQQPANAPPSAQEMADAMAATMPGIVHAQLAKLEGKWKVTMSIILDGIEPEKSEGTAELKMILGGRFIQETGDESMMGFPVEHSRLWGYNNGSKKYQAVWLYTMSTGFLQMEGTSDNDGKSIQWKGHFDNESGIREDITAVTTFVDDDHFEMELSAGEMPDGSAGPKMKSAYARMK